MKPRMIRLHYKTLRKLIYLKKKAQVNGAYRVARRIRAVILNHKGKTSGEISNILKTPRSRVSEWLKNYEQYGYEGLLEGYRPGRSARLNRQQLSVLCDIINGDHEGYGIQYEMWTSTWITSYIEEEFGVGYHPGHVRRLMHQLGFSLERTRRARIPSSPEEIMQEYGVSYNEAIFLHQMCFRVKWARPVKARLKPKKQDRWHRYTYPNLKKKPELGKQR